MFIPQSSCFSGVWKALRSSFFVFCFFFCLFLSIHKNSKYSMKENTTDSSMTAGSTDRFTDSFSNNDPEKAALAVPQLQRHLLTPVLRKRVPPIPDKSEKKPCPESLKRPLSYIFFWWLIPLMRIGYKRTLQNEDLWTLHEGVKVNNLYNTFIHHIEKQTAKNRAKAKKANPNISEEELDEAAFTKVTLPLALFLTFKWKYSISVFLKLSYDVGSSLVPLLTKLLVNFISLKATHANTPLGKGIGYCIGQAFLTLVVGVANTHYVNLSTVCGLEARAIFTKALLEKSFRIDGKGRQRFSNGKITSLMGADLSRIDMAISLQPVLMTIIFPIVITITLLVVNIGVAALVGIGVFISMISLISYMSTISIKIREKASVHTDQRVSLISEVVNSMKMIKYYAWERPYHQKIREHREIEMKHTFHLHFIRSFFLAMAVVLPILCPLFSFLVMNAVSPNRTAGDIFSSLSLFSLLTEHIVLVPMALGYGFDAYVGLNRIADFLKASEHKDTPPDVEKQEKLNLGFNLDNSKAIQVKGAEFKWDAIEAKEQDDANSMPADNNNSQEESSEPFSTTTALAHSLSRVSGTVVDPSSFTGLHNLNFEIEKGEFVIVTGSIGSGKSSLLNAVAGFMPKKAGVLQVNDSLLLCGYPWVQNATVKENVVFGQQYDAIWYHQVIHACALDADLSMLPAGDLTEVGEKGITLSGGQKARINLARAVYNNREIVLFDDVLSAVDARVGKHIVDNCFLGLLKNKTRVLATHQLSLINQADRIIFLNNQGEAVVGTLEQLQESNEDFARLMEFSHQLEEEMEKEDFNEIEEIGPKDDEDADDITVGKESVLEKVSAIQHNKSDSKYRKETEMWTSEEESESEYQNRSSSGNLTGKEEKAENKLSWLVYKNYLTAAFGRATAPMVVVLFVGITLATFLQLFTNTWLSFWVDKRFEGKSTGFYVGIYVMLGAVMLLFTVGEFGIIAFISTTSSKNLNLKAVKNLLYTPISFMDTTPTGRILNRFTKDTDALDNEMNEQLSLLTYCAATIIGVLILCCTYMPYILIAAPVLGMIFISLASFYQASARELKRLDAVNRSFVFNTFSECLNGVNTIKAYNAQSDFIKKNDKNIDTMNEAGYLNVAALRFLGTNYQIIGFVVILLVSLLCVTGQFHISAASSGLVLSYVLQLVGLLSLVIRSVTKVENEMNSAERMISYVLDLPQEAPYEKPETKPSPEWPQNGAIEFKNVDMRYRRNLPLVLKDLSFEVKPGEKIGICGRTGAGKSSLMTALYRLSELDRGAISIDGVDISSLGLYDLRSKLCIIPQDPVLFKGTIRSNLDPFKKHTDEKLWDALRRSGLIDIDILPTVKQQKRDTSDTENFESLHKFHLDQQVEENGDNFSLGEKQLLALARALVIDAKILILDEATSSVDYETDANINNTIRNEFSHCTILCIAHRLHTILKFDKIMVLDKGTLSEFNTPINLFKQTDTIFRDMCDRSNITEQDFEV